MWRSEMLDTKKLSFGVDCTGVLCDNNRDLRGKASEDGPMEIMTIVWAESDWSRIHSFTYTCFPSSSPRQ